VSRPELDGRRLCRRAVRRRDLDSGRTL